MKLNRDTDTSCCNQSKRGMNSESFFFFPWMRGGGVHRIDKVATTTMAFYGEKPRTRKEVEDVGNVYQDYFFYESDTLHSMLNCTRIIQFYFLHESPLSIGLIRPTTASSSVTLSISRYCFTVLRLSILTASTGAQLTLVLLAGFPLQHCTNVRGMMTLPLTPESSPPKNLKT